MDVLTQRHKAKFIYKIPEGLRELMSDISREVIREQPTEVYCFIADYLDALFITRMNVLVAERVTNSVTRAAETIANAMYKSQKSRTTIDKTAKLIQKSFKNYLERRKKIDEQDSVDEDLTANLMAEINCNYEDASNAAITIQQAFKNFKLKKEEEFALLGKVDWRLAASKTIKLYKKVTRFEEDMVHAVNLIKAAYKGYYTRRLLREEKAKSQIDPSATGDDEIKDYLSEDLRAMSSRVAWHLPSMSNKSITITDNISYIDEDLLGKTVEQRENLEIAKSVLDDILESIDYQDRDDLGIITIKPDTDYDADDVSTLWTMRSDDRVVDASWGVVVQYKGSEDTMMTTMSAANRNTISAPGQTNLAMGSLETFTDDFVSGMGSEPFEIPGPLNQSEGGERPSWAGDDPNLVIHIEGVEEIGEGMDWNMDEPQQENVKLTQRLSTILEHEG